MSSIFKMKYPASAFGGNWREGTPLGNGLHGAVMYGRIRREKIALMHTKLWRGGTQPSIPCVSDVLPQMREAVFNGEITKANGMLCDALKERGYNPQTAAMVPAADINIELPSQAAFKHYSRELDMESGEGTVRYEIDGKTALRRAFVSRADDVVVIECDAESEIDISVHEPDIPFYKDSDVPAKNQVVKRDGEWLFFRCDVNGEEHGAVARIVRKDTALIIARLYYDGDSKTQWHALKEYIETLKPNYNALFAKHSAIHKELFSRCRFELKDDDIRNYVRSNEELLDIAYDDELPNALTCRMWDYGRYLFISATSENGYPCVLTGLWGADYNAMWSFNMANINLQMIHWHCLPGNLGELLKPLFGYFDSSMDEMRENAQKIFGCRGIVLPAVTTPGGMKNVCMSPHIVNWVGGAGWVAQLYYDYYLFTRDTEFLKKSALPFMREAALFYGDFIIRSENIWHICPSVSPENKTCRYNGVDVEWEENVQIAADATLDVAIIKDLCANLLQIAKNTSLISPEEANEYEWIKEHAPEYKINEYGAPREWLDDRFADNDRHRHQSHLFPMFPGFEKVRVDAETDALYRRGGIRRMTEGVDCQTSWSHIQNANMMARTGDGELALQSLNVISKTSVMSNLFTNHNDWRGSGLTLTMQYAPFQIDANIGWQSAVIEMLLYSYTDRMDILPALPKKWRSGKITGLRTRCGTSVDIKWNNSFCKVQITALRSTEFCLYMPDGSSEKLLMKKCEKIARSCCII